MFQEEIQKSYRKNQTIIQINQKIKEI